jgi:hypothetical protein
VLGGVTGKLSILDSSFISIGYHGGWIAYRFLGVLYCIVYMYLFIFAFAHEKTAIYKFTVSLTQPLFEVC